MRLRVHEQGGEIHVDVDGVAGRQQRVPQALTECQRRATDGALPSEASEINVRAGADRMRIRRRGSDGSPLQAAAIYQCLRAALADPGGAARSPAP